MIEQREKLSDIKGQYTCLKAFDLTWTNKMSENDTYISSWVLQLKDLSIGQSLDLRIENKSNEK